jgi:archaeosine synthase
MRYLARRYGEFFGQKIPDVFSIDNIPVERQKLDTRKDQIFLSGKFAVLNRVNRLNTREFVRTVTEARLKFPDKLIYLPAFGLPNDYPILFYMGIDLLDDSPIHLLGNDRCTSEFGLYKGTGCMESNIGEKNRILNLVRLSLDNEKFREVVETHSFTNFSREALRILDMEFYPYIEKFMDYRPKNIVAASLEGVYRPEIVDFRKRTENLKQTSDNLLLIPCSAVKPYSTSKTHRILHSFIHQYLSGFQEVIVTSPLGLVPRELESLFPAMYYDIPVTGHWFEEEKKVLIDFGKKYFKNKNFTNVFYILPEGEAKIVEMFNNAEGIIGSINFENSQKLAKIIGAHGIVGDKRRKESTEYSNVLKFLFDLEVEPEKISQVKEGNRRIVRYDGSPILKKTVSGFTMMKGLGEILAARGTRTIETEGIFRGDNLFIPGIKGITDDVKPGMEIVLVKDGEVVGRGLSQVSEIDLSIEKKGIGVKEVEYFDGN